MLEMHSVYEFKMKFLFASYSFVINLFYIENFWVTNIYRKAINKNLIIHQA